MRNTGGVVTGVAFEGMIRVPAGSCCIDAVPEPNPCRSAFDDTGCFIGCQVTSRKRGGGTNKKNHI